MKAVNRLTKNVLGILLYIILMFPTIYWCISFTVGKGIWEFKIILAAVLFGLFLWVSGILRCFEASFKAYLRLKFKYKKNPNTLIKKQLDILKDISIFDFLRLKRVVSINKKKISKCELDSYEFHYIGDDKGVMFYRDNSIHSYAYVWRNEDAIIVMDRYFFRKNVSGSKRREKIINLFRQGDFCRDKEILVLEKGLFEFEI
jgi:hypothetical protein